MKPAPHRRCPHHYWLCPHAPGFNRYHPGEFILKEMLIPVLGGKLQPGFHQTLGSRKEVIGGGRDYKRQLLDEVEREGERTERWRGEKKPKRAHRSICASTSLSLLHHKSSSHVQTRLLQWG